MASVTWADVRRALDGRPARQVAAAVTSRAAVAVILRPAGGALDGEGVPLDVLFIRRAEHPKDPWSGQMGFPGGRAEPGDAGLAATAVRETFEEIGVDLGACGEPLGALDEVRAMARMRPLDLTIQPYVFRLREPAEARPSAEVTSVHWLPLDELLAPESRGLMDYPREDTALRFPCLRLRGVVIWGLTFRMFTSLAERLETD